MSFSEPMITPSVYDHIEITRTMYSVVQVPHTLEGLAELCEWVNSSGDWEAVGVCEDGFRFRCVDPIGQWEWVEPDLYLVYVNDDDEDGFEVLMPEELDFLAYADHVKGPKLPHG